MDGLIIGLLLPFAGTTLGAACVFLMKKQMPDLVQKTLLGFASGVMVAASVWSLLIPSIEMSGTENATRVIPAVSGFIAGIAFLLLMDRITPHLHLGSPSPEGPHSKLSRTSMLVLAVTLHNIPEGMAVGVALAAAMEHSTYLPMAGALALSMIYVVVEELIPEASQGKHSNVGTVGFALGFVLMMILDVVLG